MWGRDREEVRHASHNVVMSMFVPCTAPHTSTFSQHIIRASWLWLRPRSYTTTFCSGSHTCRLPICQVEQKRGGELLLRGRACSNLKLSKCMCSYPSSAAAVCRELTQAGHVEVMGRELAAVPMADHASACYAPLNISPNAENGQASCCLKAIRVLNYFLVSRCAICHFLHGACAILLRLRLKEWCSSHSFLHFSMPIYLSTSRLVCLGVCLGVCPGAGIVICAIGSFSLSLSLSLFLGRKHA